MPAHRYVLLQRGVPGKQESPSPAQLQEMYGAFNAWKEKFKDNIVDMGGRLTPGGKILRMSGVMDGPLIEAKEVIGGYMVVSADSYDVALEIASGCPGLIAPGSSCEIRQIMGPRARPDSSNTHSDTTTPAWWPRSLAGWASGTSSV